MKFIQIGSMPSGSKRVVNVVAVVDIGAIVVIVAIVDIVAGVTVVAGESNDMKMSQIGSILSGSNLTVVDATVPTSLSIS